MTFEFFGLPGVGKSTLYKELAKDEKFEFVSMKSKRKIVFNFFMFFIKNKRYTALSILYTLKHRRTLAVFWSTCIVRLAHYNVTKNAKSKKIIILEEGPLQNILSYAEALQNKHTFEKYLSATPISDKVIILNLDEDVRKERLSRRNFRRNEKKDFFEKSDGAMKVVNQYLLEVVKNDKNYLVFTSGEAVARYLMCYEKIA